MSSINTAQPLRLKRHEDKRIRKGHDWVFSNEVDVATTPLQDFAPGGDVVVQDYLGQTIGTGYVNPQSLICARIVSRDARHPFLSGVLVHRLQTALSLRERLFRDRPYYRWVFGESDGLPGLVVDRFDSTLVVQVTTAGMEQQLDAVLATLNKLVRPAVVYLRNDTAVRELEGLPLYAEAVMGEVQDTVMVREHGQTFLTPLARGQKTGWYFDQADNRGWLRRLACSGQVLDLFCYTGAWGVQAAVAGADSVLCVDDSANACEWAQVNAQRNAVVDKVTTLTADAFSALKQLREQAERFDVVLVDPPAFIKRKKDLASGTAGYRRLAQMAMQVAARDALLVFSSCSQQLSRAALLDILYDASRHLGRRLVILGYGSQAMDHPVHPAMPETEYLKTVFARVLLG